MSQSSTHSTGNGPEFNLPDEVLSVIPTDPYDQLDIARKITSMAIASRVSKLESEVDRLRQKVYDKDSLILELEQKVSHLQQAFHEADMRLRISREDNMKIAKERDSLSITTKKLGRDFAKLETFKRQLMQSLNDDNASPAETVDIVTCDQSVSKPFTVKGGEEFNGNAMHHHYLTTCSAESGYSTDDASKQSAAQRFSITPYISPRLTPTGTPQNISTTGSPIRYPAAAGSPPQKISTGSPTKAQYEGRGGTLSSSWYPSSQQSSAANSPPRGGRTAPGRTPRIDGKEFFRQARSRLSYEQFSAFLANIKELNAQKQTREETLWKAEEIFGRDNKDLYISFQGLLNRSAAH